MWTPGPLVVCSERRRTLSAEARAMRMEDEPNLEQRFDAIVVGTGPGGATVARELTRRGRHVLIPERGAARPFTDSRVQTLHELWRPGRSLLFGERLLAILRAITLGGSSLYFWGTAWDPPRTLFARHGVELGDELDEAKRELLYVCDASVLPEPWGLPPSLTVISLGKRLAAQLTARIPERRPPIWAVPSAEGGEASP